MTGARIAVAAVAAALLVAGCDRKADPGFQGWVEANLIFVSPDESGRIETLAVSEGKAVEKGAQLFTLDDELQRADLAQAEAARVNAQQAFDRAKTLLKTAAGTQSAFESAEATLRTAQARYNSAQTRLARRRVVSPVNGSVQQIYFRVGEMVGAGRPIVALLPPDNVKVRFFVPQAALPSIALGAPVRIRCDGCEPDLTGKISFIARSAEYTPPVIYSPEERAKLVFLIEAKPDQPESLRVGQPLSVIMGEGTK